MRRLRQQPRGALRSARRDQLQRIDIGLQNAHIALGQPRRRAPPHLELLGPAGGPRFHQQIAHTQFFDKTQRFLARARSDRQHADHRAYAEDHAKPGQRRADFLRQEIFRGQRQV